MATPHQTYYKNLEKFINLSLAWEFLEQIEPYKGNFFELSIITNKGRFSVWANNIVDLKKAFLNKFFSTYNKLWNDEDFRVIIWAGRDSNKKPEGYKDGYKRKYIVIDVDQKNEKIKELLYATLGKPYFLIDSGRGWHFLYVLAEEWRNYHNLFEELHSLVKGTAIDPKSFEVNQGFRIPFSLNPKVNKFSNILEKNEIKELRKEDFENLINKLRSVPLFQFSKPRSKNNNKNGSDNNSDNNRSGKKSTNNTIRKQYYKVFDELEIQDKEQYIEELKELDKKTKSMWARITRLFQDRPYILYNLFREFFRRNFKYFKENDKEFFFFSFYEDDGVNFGATLMKNNFQVHDFHLDVTVNPLAYFLYPLRFVSSKEKIPLLYFQYLREKDKKPEDRKFIDVCFDFMYKFSPLGNLLISLATKEEKRVLSKIFKQETISIRVKSKKLNSNFWDKVFDYIHKNNEKFVVIQAPTGSGKTFSLINYLKMKKQKFIFLVPYYLLARQISKEHNIIGFYEGSDKKGNLDYIVSTWDQLELVKFLLEETGRKLEDYILVIDEVHDLIVHYGFREKQIQKIVSLFDKVKRVIGLSGTTKGLFRKVIKAQVKEREYNVHIFGIAPYYVYDKDGNKHIELKEFIRNTIKEEIEKGKKILIYLDNKQEANLLKRLFKGSNWKTKIITRESKTNENKIFEEGLLEGADIYITTTVLAEGVSLYNQDIGKVMIFKVSNFYALLQFFARLRRDNPEIWVFSYPLPEDLDKLFFFNIYNLKLEEKINFVSFEEFIKIIMNAPRELPFTRENINEYYIKYLYVSGILNRILHKPDLLERAIKYFYPKAKIKLRRLSLTGPRYHIVQEVITEYEDIDVEDLKDFDYFESKIKSWVIINKKSDKVWEEFTRWTKKQLYFLKNKWSRVRDILEAAKVRIEKGYYEFVEYQKHLDKKKKLRSLDFYMKLFLDLTVGDKIKEYKVLFPNKVVEIYESIEPFINLGPNKKVVPKSTVLIREMGELTKFFINKIPSF